MDLNAYKHWKAFKANQPSGITEVPGGITEVMEDETYGSIAVDPDFKKEDYLMDLNAYKHWKAFKANQPSGITEVPGGITEVMEDETYGSIAVDPDFKKEDYLVDWDF